MERNNITDKIMRRTVIVFKGLLELWNDAETQHWPTNDNEKIINFMVIVFHEWWLFMATHHLGFRSVKNFHGVLPNIWHSFH